MQTTGLKDFIAGEWEQQYQCQSFTPNKICIQWIMNNPKLL